MNHEFVSSDFEDILWKILIVLKSCNNSRVQVMMSRLELIFCMWCETLSCVPNPVQNEWFEWCPDPLMLHCHTHTSHITCHVNPSLPVFIQFTIYICTVSCKILNIQFLNGTYANVLKIELRFSKWKCSKYCCIKLMQHAM